jgi:beta-1,4-mannooligosaccharide/beta-1,4-mannosyl-N-acetylglucosamine phosphorylase
MKTKAVAPALPNMPWQDRPAGESDVLWRYSANPVIRRDAIPTSNNIFNSTVVPFNSKFAGVFRADNRTVRMRIHAGFSDNAIDWRIDSDPIKFIGAPADIAKQTYAYDPRVTPLDGATGRLAIHYGAADTVTCLAFGFLDEIVEFIRTNPETYV